MATVTKDDRKNAMIRAAQARANITSLLVHRDAPAHLDDIYPVVKSLDYDKKMLSSLLGRMANDKLVEKVDIEHPDFKVGYVAKDIVEPPTQAVMPVRRSTYKTREPKITGKEPAIDVKVNEKARSLTIRAFGMVLRISKED